MPYTRNKVDDERGHDWGWAHLVTVPPFIYLLAFIFPSLLYQRKTNV